MKTKDLTVVIKNIPSKAIDELWEGLAETASEIDNSIIEPVNPIIIDWSEGLLTNRVIQILSGVFAYHCATTSMQQNINLNDIQNKNE